MTNLPRSPRALAESLYASRGALTRKQIASSHSTHALKKAVKSGAVVRMLPGVYAHARHAQQADTRAAAAVAWIGERGALTSRSALWRMAIIDEPPDRVTLWVQPGLHLDAPSWIRVSRSDIAPRMLVSRGLRTLSPSQALVEGWNEERGDAGVELIVRAVTRGRVPPVAVRAAVDATPRVRARRELIELLGLLDRGVNSYLEHRARTRVFTDRAFPELQRQVEVVACGRRRFLDAFDPTSRTALEFDGTGFHSSDKDRLRDLERDAELATIRIATVHFTFNDIVKRPDWCQRIYRQVRTARLADASGEVRGTTGRVS